MSFIKDRLKEIASYYGLSIRALEEKCGLGRGNISNMKDDGALGSDKLSKIFDALPAISPMWLVSGKGSMITELGSTVIATSIKSEDDGIPLIPFEAMAGVFRGEVSVNESQCDRLLIPGVKANFVIPISGNSMEPRYYSGDMVACQSMALDDVFFQWGRVYVVDTDQGVLIKRVTPGSSHDTITLVSENAFYTPFEIPRESIYHIALVKALVRIE